MKDQISFWGPLDPMVDRGLKDIGTYHTVADNYKMDSENSRLLPERFLVKLM